MSGLINNLEASVEMREELTRKIESFKSRALNIEKRLFDGIKSFDHLLNILKSLHGYLDTMEEFIEDEILNTNSVSESRKFIIDGKDVTLSRTRYENGLVDCNISVSFNGNFSMFSTADSALFDILDEGRVVEKIRDLVQKFDSDDLENSDEETV